MKTALSSSNPFASSPSQVTWAYGYEFIPEGSIVLDYGCASGDFITIAAEHKKMTAYGVEKNKDLVLSLNRPIIRHVDREIPFPDASFDVVTLFDVIEHVYDQKFLLREIRRVLKPGRMIVVTAPHQYAFSFLDPGNMKYRFRWLHKLWYTRRHSAAEYDYKYVNNPYGLIGDVDKEKAWHQHFKKAELRHLIESAGFRMTDMDGFGRYNDLMVLLGAFGIKFSEKFWAWQQYKFDNVMLLSTAKVSPN